MTVVGAPATALAASAGCLLSQQRILVLQVSPQAIPLALLLLLLLLGCRLAITKVPCLPVSRQSQEVTASLLPEAMLVSPPPVLPARDERHRNKPAPRAPIAQSPGLRRRQ